MASSRSNISPASKNATSRMKACSVVVHIENGVITLSEMVHIYQSIRRYMPKDYTVQTYIYIYIYIINTSKESLQGEPRYKPLVLTAPVSHVCVG
jgi:hypothetical protein